jgi:hypothetical protein
MLGKVLDTPGRAIPLHRLLPMKDYPRDVTALYAQGYSLTRFLVERKDRPTFLAFVKQGMRDDWDGAAQGHYGFRNVDELEQAWRADVRRRRPEEKGASKQAWDEQILVEPIRRQGPAFLTVARAAVEDDGRLVLRQQESVFQKVTTYGRSVEVSYRDVSREQERRLGLRGVAAVRVTGGATAAVDLKELAEVLRKETPVLVVENGQPLDPLLAQVAREGTLILTLPPPPKEPPPAPPRP